MLRAKADTPSNRSRNAQHTSQSLKPSGGTPKLFCPPMLPPARSSAVADSFTTREDAKKQKALQEARLPSKVLPPTPCQGSWELWACGPNGRYRRASVFWGLGCSGWCVCVCVCICSASTSAAVAVLSSEITDSSLISSCIRHQCSETGLVLPAFSRTTRFL